MNASEQLTRLARRMGDEYDRMPLADPDAITFHGNHIEMRNGDFAAIPSTNDPAAAAYVDGGNDQIFHSPVFTASINRVYCSAFRGGARLEPFTSPRIQFLTLMRNMPDRGGVRQKFTIFVEGGRDDRVPGAESVEGAAKAAGGGKEHRLHSLARELSEWLTAAAAARVMRRGDIVVMDGSLAAWGRIEKYLMLDAFAVARERGVMMCGLSKTTRLIMDSGRPLANYTMERGPGGPWYVPLGNVWDGPADGEGKTGTFMVKLHPKSKYAYRLDMPSAQLAKIERDGTERIMSSLAANSSDRHIPGYPYGMVDADRFAQVRRDEAVRYGENLRALLSPRVRAGMEMQRQHGLLNEVTS